MSVADVVPSSRDSLVDGVAFAVGGLALLGALLVTFGGPLGAPLVSLLAPLFGSWFVAVGGLLAAALAVYSVYDRSTVEQTTRAVRVPTPPSRRADAGVETAGGNLDRLLDEVHADDLDDDVTRVDASVNRKRVRDRIRQVATETLCEHHDVDPETAAELLDSGEWTDRSRARVFLGTDVAPLPLSVRLRDWASGEGFRRRASATIEAVATTAGVDHGASLAPPPVGDDADHDRQPVDWPPEPSPGPGADADERRLDRLLRQPVEEFESAGESDPTSEPEPEPEPETGPDAEVFRREVIPGDLPAGPADTESDGDRPVEPETEGGERA